MAVAMAQAGTRAQRPLPQTTSVEQQDTDFAVHSRQSVRPGYSVSGQAVGSTIDQPLSSAPGYYRYWDLMIITTGGVAGAGVLSADSVTGNGANFVGFLQAKDSFGTPVFTGNGFEMLFLVQLYSGQVGISSAAVPNNWPQFVALTAGAGNGRYYCRIPFEIGGHVGYGTISAGAASLQPTLHVVLNSSAGVYSTAPTTTAVVAFTVDEAFYSVPIEPAFQGLTPPGLGTTLQWTQLVATPTVASASSQRIQLPRLGGFVSTLILEGRDSLGARTDSIFPAFGTNQRIRIYADGVPIRDEAIDERSNEMFIEFPGVTTRPAGVFAYSFKQFESQMVLGYLDSLVGFLSTNPGTQLEIECTPWGTQANSPATITVLVGQVVPRGAVQYGIEG
jgi:hypothetical protein